MSETPETSRPEIFVLANNIRSLYNVGALFRLGDGLGISKLYLCGMTGAPFEGLRFQRQRNQIAKTALEGLASVPWEYHQSALDSIERLRSDHVQIVALEQTSKSIPYTQATYQFPICIILGHETEGVETDVLDACDLHVDIPMLGQGKSLNVISAASILLGHLRSLA